MTKPFTVNATRFDPYKNYAFRVYFGNGTTPVAAVSKVSNLTRTTAKIDYKEGGSAINHKGPGRTEYNAITLERGVTHDTGFEEWANAAQVLDKGAPQQSLANLRRQLRIELLNEEYQLVMRWIVYNAWVTEYQTVSDLDAGGSAVAIEHIKLENEGWERDLSVTEPQEK